MVNITHFLINYACYYTSHSNLTHTHEVKLTETCLIQLRMTKLL